MPAVVAVLVTRSSVAQAPVAPVPDDSSEADPSGPDQLLVEGLAEPQPDDLSITLQSLADQDYRNLSVLVIDAGPDAVADQVAAILPEANVHRLGGLPGFAGAANQALSLVTGGSFFLFLSDGVALDENCVSKLVEELYRSNAGMVTPKLVQWDDPRRLAAIGMGSDRFGVQVDLVEPGDFDQEQYDGVRDVFVAPTGVQLVRADLFRALEGFDALMESASEDLDLCWRAQVAGARVVAVPAAVARVRAGRVGTASEALPARDRSVDERRRRLSRNRLRTLLVTSSRFSLLRVVPLAVLLLVLEAVYSLAAGRRKQAGSALSAVAWNATRLGDIRARRATLAPLRQVGDRDVHALQVGGSARINQFFRGQFSVSDRLLSLAGSVRDSFSGDDSSAVRDASIIGGLLTIILLFGSRSLITDGVTPVGQFLTLPGAGPLLGEWLGDWRSAGVGGRGHAPLAFAVLGVLKALFFWADGLLDLLLVLVPLCLGVVGAWRLARPLASARASALAALAYAGNPLLVAIMAAGRWDSLMVWGGAPFVVASLLRVQGLAPYGTSSGLIGATVIQRELPIRLLRFGFLVAVVATFVPAAVVLAVLLAASLMVGSFLSGRVAGMKNLFLAVVVAVVVPAALHGPWTIDIVRNFEWNWFIGPPSPEATFDSLADLIRFAPDGDPGRILPFGLLLAAGLSLLIANSIRYEAAVRGWFMAVAFFGLAWVSRRGWLPMDLPSVELLLVPAAVGLSLAVGAGARAVDVDLVGYRFGWRHMASFVGVVALAATALSLLGSASSGRWDQPTQGFGRSTTLLAAQYDGPARVLWIGSPVVLPIDASSSTGGTSFAVSDGGTPTVFGRWAPTTYGFENDIGASLDLASAGDTARLGRLLAPYGIDLIVVAEQLAPAPYVGPSHDAGGGIGSALAQQLDLQRVSGTPGLVVYRNVGARGPLVAFPDDANLPPGGDTVTRLNTDLTSGTRLSVGEELRPSIALMKPPDVAGSRILVAVQADGWVLEGEGSDSASLSEAFGGLLVVDGAGTSAEISDGGLSLSRPAPWLRRFALLGQLFLIGAGAMLAQSRLEDSP